MSRTLVVGDTHGNYKGLRVALQNAKYDLGIKDRLIVLGDTMDGWSQAPETIEYYKDLQALGAELIYILGNHDVGFIEWVENGAKPHRHMMYGHGGMTTEWCYLNRWNSYIEDHIKWFKEYAKPYFIDSSNRLFVHAGFDPTIPFLDEMQGKNQEYAWNRSFIQGMYAGRNYAKDFNEVYVGHTPTFTLKSGLYTPLNRRNVWDIDTGAGFYKGKVTVLDIDTKEYWQSKTGREHYPIEIGRGH